MIGIIDSGMGGLTTLTHLARAGADSAFCYYADVRNAPYGALGPTAIMQATRTAAERLTALGARAVVLGCNTATAAALGYLQSVLPVPVYGVHPPLETAKTAGGRTLLVATSFTCRRYKRSADIEVLALPRLATLVDTYYPTQPQPIENYCRTMLQGVGDMDNLVLGCTHYVLIKDMLQALTRAKKVLDGNAELTARMGAAPTLGKGLSVDILASGDIDTARYYAIISRLMES